MILLLFILFSSLFITVFPATSGKLWQGPCQSAISSRHLEQPVLETPDSIWDSWFQRVYRCPGWRWTY